MEDAMAALRGRNALTSLDSVKTCQSDDFRAKEGESERRSAIQLLRLHTANVQKTRWFIQTPTTGWPGSLFHN